MSSLERYAMEKLTGTFNKLFHYWNQFFAQPKAWRHLKGFDALDAWLLQSTLFLFDDLVSARDILA